VTDDDVNILVLIAVLAVGTVTLKAVGPLLAGGRTPPPALERVIALLAPALITALVVTDTVGDGQAVVLDARAVGLGVGAVALWLRAPAVVALVLAAAACALTRMITN
jgi:branched-subunit amino acid transport protein